MSSKGQTGQTGPKTSQQKRPSPRTDNFLESLRDIGNSSLGSLKKDFVQGIPEDIFGQIFGLPEKPQRNVRQDLRPGQSLEIDTMLREEREENKVLRQKLAREQQLRQDDQSTVEQKTRDLKLELQALTQEVGQLAKTTQGLARETQIAVIYAPANPGIYHVVFFEKLREFISSFRKKIENASLWLQSYNKRSAKKHTFWGQVGKSGSKRLLSPEDYLQRSAG